MSPPAFPDTFPHKLASSWSLASATLIADTHTSRIYRATGSDGGSTIVKQLKPQGERELSGFTYLAWRAGSAAVRILATEGNCCLLEDAGAETLSAYQHQHGDVAATAVLLSLIPKLHAASAEPVPDDLLPLDKEFDALFALAECDGPHADMARWASAEARDLLASQTNIKPLHGDLHHDNVLRDTQGAWRAIDPRGLVGDPVYDVTNIFGNPPGATSTILSTERISRLARDFSALLDCPANKVLRFAGTRAMLSVAWSLERPGSASAQQNVDERLAFANLVRQLLADGS